MRKLHILLSGNSINAQDTTECEDGFHLFEHEYLAGDPICISDLHL